MGPRFEPERAHLFCKYVNTQKQLNSVNLQENSKLLIYYRILINKNNLITKVYEHNYYGKSVVKNYLSKILRKVPVSWHVTFITDLSKLSSQKIMRN